MGTANIAITNIESQAQDNILSFIDNRVYVKDPRSPSSITKDRPNFVVETDPFHKGISFSDFPYIVVEFPNVEYSAISVDGKHKNISWLQNITVRAAKDGAANTRADDGRNDMLNIGDDLQETFNNEVVKQALRDVGIYELNLIKNSTDTLVANQKPIYESSYQLTYMTRLKVSE